MRILMAVGFIISFGAGGTCQKCTSSGLSFLNESLDPSPKDLPLIDKGVIGTTFPIEEEDIAQVISRKLHALESEGKLQALIRTAQAKTKQALENPSPVKGIKSTTTFRRFTFDPTFEVLEDIKDHKGTLIHKKGTHLNPLDHMSFGEPLIFIDGTDASHVKEFGTTPGKLVLVKGSPLKLSKELKKSVYFDQGGFLTQKFGITHVPCRVFQEGPLLVVEEGPVS